MNLKKNILSVIALTFVLTINSNAYEAVTIPMPKIYKGIKIIPNNNVDFPPASYSITKHYSYEIYRVGKRGMLQPITFVDERYSISPGSRLKDLACIFHERPESMKKV